MRRSENGLNVPLNQRREGGPASPKSEEARPCWVRLGAPEPLEGTVHAWRRDPESGTWRALVAVWLPADAVRPRDS
jgi:hypothetical protein